MTSPALITLRGREVFICVRLPNGEEVRISSMLIHAVFYKSTIVKQKLLNSNAAISLTLLSPTLSLDGCGKLRETDK